MGYVVRVRPETVDESASQLRAVEQTLGSVAAQLSALCAPGSIVRSAPQAALALDGAGRHVGRAVAEAGSALGALAAATAGSAADYGAQERRSVGRWESR